MDQAIIEDLTKLSDEEKNILHGQAIDRGDYSVSERFIVNSAKLLEGKALALRPHTRFVDFPEHGHDYMEFMYVYTGQITHVIDKEDVTLERGDILFLNRHARHSIRRAGQEDVGINFILSEDLLQTLLPLVQGNEVMSDFIFENFDDAGEAEYLFFHTRDNFPIRNLMDNLIYAVVNRSEPLYAGLVILLFSYLAYYRETLANALRIPSKDAQLKRGVTEYLERHYPTATLGALAAELGYAQAYLSRRIRKVFGKSFQKLLCETRLRVAAGLLTASGMRIEEIVRAVGYENRSYFYRRFIKKYGVTPKKYRKAHAKGAPSRP